MPTPAVPTTAVMTTAPGCPTARPRAASSCPRCSRRPVNALTSAGSCAGTATAAATGRVATGVGGGVVPASRVSPRRMDSCISVSSGPGSRPSSSARSAR
ncbi:hypothetical protein ACFQX7_31130 [Luedemannella flava]